MTDELDLVRRLRPDVSDEPDVVQGVLQRERTRLMSSIETAARQATPQTTRQPVAQAMVPQLAYEDIGEALAWLTRAFGFRERQEARFALADGRVGHAEMEAAAGATFMLGESGGHGLASPGRGGGANQMLSVYVDDVDAHFERARRAGVRITDPLEDRFYGRVYECLDLDGHRWMFLERRGEE